MKKSTSHFILSLVDQCAVSGGNFLTIALGAALLPMDEQGKLISIYTVYIALVLFNVSVFFSAANIVRDNVESSTQYRHVLLSAQIGSAPLALAVVFIGLMTFQGALRWYITASEMAFLSGFLIFQQIADFHRRAGYVFDLVGRAALQSVLLYGARIAAILYLRPETVSGFLFAMALPAFPLALYGVIRCLLDRGKLVGADGSRDIARLHLSLSKWNIYGAPLRWAGLHLPILFVGALHSLEAAAILGTLRAITTFANVLLELLETSVPAWLSGKRQQGQQALLSGSLALLGVGSLIWAAGMAAMALMGETVIRNMLDAEYAAYTPVLYVIWAGNGIYFVGRTVGLHYRMQQNSKLEFLGLAMGACALLLSVPLIPLYGVWGGAWSLVIVQVATLGGLLASRPGS